MFLGPFENKADTKILKSGDFLYFPHYICRRKLKVGYYISFCGLRWRGREHKKMGYILGGQSNFGGFFVDFCCSRGVQFSSCSCTTPWHVPPHWVFKKTNLTDQVQKDIKH